ncbi:NAD(P)H-dependent oxidoreductase [Candidatus Methylospira mobilis]|uniref:NAD(P)H-dependent oxidoreductase n=1 Tax=Candidatus Methylospira mobilis TaxID=1808979 RepID=UPI0028F04693|nr:NAD(P)H-dependent oxidoreductase [Candidatus Methylospira mobilis]WNV04158.1 NAD(P)H-dependent oxidoreductase [Candidatus Methylospira mobilis]
MSIVGISGSLADPSRTSVLVDLIVGQVAVGAFSKKSFVSIAGIAPSLGAALDPQRIPAEIGSAYEKLIAADVIVVGTPVYKGSYSGLLKHFFDLLDPKSLRGKVAVLAATGGSDHHSLVLEHQLRPLLSFFGVYTIPATVYVKDSDFVKEDGNYRLSNPDISARIDTIVAQTLGLIGRSNSVSSIAA